MELRRIERKDKIWDAAHTSSFEEGRSATDISTAIRLLAAAAREWSPELGFVACSLDVIKERNIAPCLAGAISREQIGGRYDICFQETRISDILLTSPSSKEEGKVLAYSI